MNILHLISIFRRTFAHFPAELNNEVFAFRIANFICYFINQLIGMQQKLFCFHDSKMINILLEVHSGRLLKGSTQINGIHKKLIRKLFQIDGLHIVKVNILDNFSTYSQIHHFASTFNKDETFRY